MVYGEAEILMRMLVPCATSSVTGSREYIGLAQNVLSFQASSQTVMPNCSLPEAVNVMLVPRLKVARLIEDVVGRQQHFALLKDHASFGNQGRFIGDGLPCLPGIDSTGIADDSGQRHLRRNFFNVSLLRSIKAGRSRRSSGR